MNLLMQLIPMIAIVALMYFFLLLPEKKRKKQYDSMMNSLKLNDEVMTRSGLIAKIVNMDDENVVLECGPNNTRLKFTKAAIASKVNSDEFDKK